MVWKLCSDTHHTSILMEDTQALASQYIYNNIAYNIYNINNILYIIYISNIYILAIIYI